jgi:uncharacterized protein (TIGR02646 family)
LALAGDRLDQLLIDGGLEWRKLLRRGAKQGRVFLRFTGGTSVDLRFNVNKHWWVGGAPRMAAFVRGYGATRLLEGKIAGTGDGTNVRLANLFDPRAPVLDAERWLLGLQDEGDFHVAGLTLGGFLGVDDSARPFAEPTSPVPFITRDLGRREVLAGGDPLSYASDGYRAVVALVCDVIAGLGVGLSDMRNATGIVLLDEIGAHLHPRWKMEITGRLRREFPQLQFLVSTHEPLCLRGLFAREVIRVRKLRPERAPDAPLAPGRVSLEVIERSPSDYRVDQLLTSEFFGLDTTIDPDLDRPAGARLHPARPNGLRGDRRAPDRRRELVRRGPQPAAPADPGQDQGHLGAAGRPATGGRRVVIRVERKAKPAALDQTFTRGKNKGKTERQVVEAALEAHLAPPDSQPLETFTFDYQRYKDDEVKQALEAAFAGKCAYCETFYSVSQPMDVEHWRPKGEVHLADGTVLKPGYYWLASDWHNLFPSCIDCNCARQQHDVIEQKRILLGKANQFPLADETVRVRSHDPEPDLNVEQALLVDPCNEDPERFFSYTEEGAIVQPFAGSVV